MSNLPKTIKKEQIFKSHFKYCLNKWFPDTIFLTQLSSFPNCTDVYHQICGHSTTTWIKFYPFLTTYPPRVDNHAMLIFTGKSFLEACNICRTSCVPELFLMSKRTTKKHNLCTKHVLQVFWAYSFHEQWTICRHMTKHSYTYEIPNYLVLST